MGNHVAFRRRCSSARGAMLSPLAAEVQSMLRRANQSFPNLSAAYDAYPDLGPRSQVGGEPFFIQGYPTCVCPSCSSDMPLLAALDGYDEVLFSEAEVIGGQCLYHLCCDCRVITAVHESD